MTFSASGRARSSEVRRSAGSCGVGDTVISSGGGNRASCRGSSRCSCGSFGSFGNCGNSCSFDSRAITAISSARAGSSGVGGTVTVVPSARSGGDRASCGGSCSCGSCCSCNSCGSRAITVVSSTRAGGGGVRGAGSSGGRGRITIIPTTRAGSCGVRSAGNICLIPYAWLSSRVIGH